MDDGIIKLIDEYTRFHAEAVDDAERGEGGILAQMHASGRAMAYQQIVTALIDLRLAAMKARPLADTNSPPARSAE